MTPSELSDLLWAQVDRVAPHLLPNGKKEGHEWVAGNVNGDKGNSLKVNLSGKKKWADFAEGDGGDMLDLWMACRGINLHQAMQEAKAFLGIKDDDHHSMPNVRRNSPDLIARKSPATLPKQNPILSTCNRVAYRQKS